MKTRSIIIVSFVLLSLGTVSQESAKKDHIWTYQGKKKENTIGMYGGLYGSFSPVLSDPAAYLGYRVGVVFNKRFGVGLAGFGLSYDRTLNEIVDDGSYHLQAGYSGIFLEYIQPLGENFKIGASIITGSGIALYSYDKDFVDDKEWYEETIDRDVFHVFEPGLEVQTRLAGKWWLGAYATYRISSPLELKGTNDDILQNYTAGLSLKFGVF